MIDASHLSFTDNIALTRKVVRYAHKFNVTVEAEIGRLAGIEDDLRIKKTDAVYTDPNEARKFVSESGCDALAIAIGTSHGAYKFTRKPDGAILAMKVVEEIHRRLPNTHLVMHGSSSVPQELQDAFNAAGGQMPQTWGVPVEEIQRGIKFGVRKINIDTDLRLSFVGALREILATKPQEFDPRKILGPGREAIQQTVQSKMKLFGSSGKAA